MYMFLFYGLKVLGKILKKCSYLYYGGKGFRDDLNF